jgi:hypothetical protein
MATTKKLTKSSFIRSQPDSMSAADVVAAGKKVGLTLTVASVYTTRYEAKKKAAGGKSPAKSASKPGPKPASATAAKPAAKGKPGPKPKAQIVATNEEQAFKRLVLSVGLAKAEGYLSDLKRSVGL